MAYALPMMQPEFVNPQKTPNLLDWLKRVYDRPAIEETFKLGRTPMAERAMDVRKILHGEPDDA
jgi:glutathione S-transferase/GST-like protein